MAASKELKRFNYLSGETTALYHEASLKLGLSDSESMVLYVLCCEGKRGISEVCRLSGLSKQTVNSTLRKLESEELIKLVPLDGKQKSVALTPKGNRLVKKTTARLVEAENRVFDGWSEQERAEYLRLTEKYLTDFRREVEKL